MHEPCGYSLDLVSSFDSKQNKNNFYRGKVTLTDNENKYCEE